MTRMMARTEFASAVSQVAREHGIDPKIVLESIRVAIIAAFRRDLKEKGKSTEDEDDYKAEINPKSGEAKIFLKKRSKKDEVTPPGFGRIATLTAKQVILQKIREAEKEAVIGEYQKRLGTIVSGTILRFTDSSAIIDIGKTEALMPREEKTKNEKYHLNMRLAFFLKEIRETPRGQQIIVSRKDNGLVRGLFKREVPEVANNAVEIKAIAREPGVRIKVAVFSSKPGVDPVGSCVGQKGIRVQAVIDELQRERIDIIQYSEEPAVFIAAALSPAENPEVKVDKKKKVAEVLVPDNQLAVAIGKEGQNVRLASQVTGFNIKVRSKTKTKTTQR